MRVRSVGFMGKVRLGPAAHASSCNPTAESRSVKPIAPGKPRRAGLRPPGGVARGLDQEALHPGWHGAGRAGAAAAVQWTLAGERR